MRNSYLVKLCHGFLDAVSNDGPDRIGTSLQDLSNFRALVFREILEHKVLRVAHRMLRHDPDPQANKLICSEAIDDRPKTIVSAVRTTGAEPDPAKRQCQVIRDDDYPLDIAFR